jgi:hypothetical protein
MSLCPSFIRSFSLRISVVLYVLLFASPSLIAPRYPYRSFSTSLSVDPSLRMHVSPSPVPSVPPLIRISFYGMIHTSFIISLYPSFLLPHALYVYRLINTYAPAFLRVSFSPSLIIHVYHFARKSLCSLSYSLINYVYPSALLYVSPCILTFVYPSLGRPSSRLLTFYVCICSSPSLIRSFFHSRITPFSPYRRIS